MLARLAVGKAITQQSRVASRHFGALTFKNFDAGVQGKNQSENSSETPKTEAPPQRLWLNVHPGFAKQEWILPAEKANSIHHLDDLLEDIETMQAMNRNARRAKKANKGARPCSRASRRKKKEKIGKRRRSY